MKIRKKLKNVIVESGYDEPIYSEFREELAMQNSRMVNTTSFIGSILMILLTIGSLFMPSVTKVLPLYAGTAIAFILIFIAARATSKKPGRVNVICNYLFLLAAFFFGMGLDIIQKNATATTICVLLVALPLLVVDRPFREFFFFLAMSICFILESYYIKQSPKASIDALNSVSFLILGSFLGYKHNQMVLRNIKGHHLLRKQRDMDPLTSLYNKAALEFRAREYLGKAETEQNITAGMIVIDMDNFKFVNDTYGHHAGDEILTKFGEILHTLFEEPISISRFGGDEFVVFMPGVCDKAILSERATKILEGVKTIRITADDDYRAHICMGIATYPADGTDYDEIFKHADTAMYIVKKNGKNNFGFYDADLKRKILVVDDIEMNRAILKETLVNEYAVFEAENGAKALQVLAENPDTAMVITDIQMPGMDGIELIKQIRSNRSMGEIAIIANTQYGDITQEEMVFKLGVDDFVYKAASPRIIQMRVKNVLRARDWE